MDFPGLSMNVAPQDSESSEDEQGQAARSSFLQGLQVMSAPQAPSEESEPEDAPMQAVPAVTEAEVEQPDAEMEDAEEQSEDDTPLAPKESAVEGEPAQLEQHDEEDEATAEAPKEQPQEEEEDEEQQETPARADEEQEEAQAMADEEQEEAQAMADEEQEEVPAMADEQQEEATAMAARSQDQVGEPEEEGADEGDEEQQPNVLEQAEDEEDETASAQLVALPNEEVPHTQLVLAGREDPWSSQRPEVNGEWTVSVDTCSLNVGGAVMKLPKAILERLYDYQRQGVAWMWQLYQKEFGGILADEMGLGKTVQAAAFLASLKITQQGSRFLVVVPVTLIENWRRELQTWAGSTDLAVFVLHGTPQERRTALRNVITKGGVLITSYDMVRTQIKSIRTADLGSAAAAPKRKKKTKRGCRDDDSPSEAEDIEYQPRQDGKETKWDVIMIDEGHQIKNPACVAGKELRRIESRSRFLITGTPLQNQLSDIWALMDFAQPGLLGNHATFEKSFSEQITRGSKKNATKFQIELKDHLARELKQITAPHFLRRMKDEINTESKKVSMMSNTSASSSSAAPGRSLAAASVAPNPDELPPKTDVVLWINLTQAQLEMYDMYLNSELVRRATGAQKCGMEALRAIALLKKLCNHPLMCLPRGEFDDWYRQTVQSGAAPAAKRPRAVAAAPSVATPIFDDAAGGDDAAPECQHVHSRLQALVPGSVEGAALLSSKLRVLSVLLPQLQRRGHRVLLFSQSTLMLDLIQACVLRVLGLKFLRIDGTIEPKLRDVKLAKFHKEGSQYFCMCLSTQVGGVGLTITGADRVILVDPAWNPAMDDQAIARVHRIGQQSPVVVYRLIGSGSIEDKMFRLQVFKRGLAKTALEHESQLRFFSHKELKQLFQAPSTAQSTQSLMAEQLGTEALEHEELLRVVAGDVGGTEDPNALAFWQSSDVLGFSDYDKLFLYLEQVKKEELKGDEGDAGDKARALSESLQSEQYKKNQVMDGKYAKSWMDGQSKENVSPQAPIPIQM